MSQNELEIGALIRQEMKKQGRKASWLAEKICCSRTNVYKLFKKTSIDLSLMQKIGKALDIDLFAYFSENQHNNKKTDNE